MIAGAYEEMMIGESKLSLERIKGMKVKQEDNVTVGWHEKFRISKVMGSANDTK